jgi:ADP-heptose:LPS heptosyltransferase
MQGSGNLSNSLTVLFGAKNNAGFYLPGQYCPDPTRFLAYPVYEPEVMRHLLLMDFLGIPMRGTQLEFPIDQLEWQEEQSLRADHGLVPGEYICIHPGARAPERRWAPSNFAQLADDLSEQGFTVALTGSAEEEPITQEVIELMRSRPVNLTGKTSIGVLGALLTHSRLLISNDTGVSHLADALNIPSIILFLSSEPRRWAPLNRSLHKVISWADAVPPQGILLEVEELLKEERSYAA